MTYEEYRARIIAAQEQWNRERDTIYDFTSRLGTSFQGEYEPPRIPGPDNYDSMTLAQMVDAVNAMRPGTVREASEAWLNIGMNLTGAIQAFNEQFGRTVTGDGTNPGWTGQSGKAAADAVTNYRNQSGNLADAACLVSFKLSEMHTGLEQTQALMPQATERPDLRDKTLPQDGVMKAGDYTEEEATQEARRILRTVYGQVATQTDHGVPVLPTAPQIVADPGQQPGISSSGAPNTSPPQATTESDRPEAAQPETTQQSDGDPRQSPETDPATTPQAVTPAGVDQSTGVQPTTSNTPSTTPSSTTTPSPNITTAPATPGRPGTTSPNTPGRPGTPFVSGAPNTAATPAPGRNVPAGPQQPNTLPAATATGSQTARTGTTGASGIAPGMGSRGKDDERETSGVKDYLVNQHNGEQLTGLDSLPKAVPPVIGENPHG
ncbi:hypothetical protein [Nocardia araoensis]|uniref:hypothetical protein n=1 Tax=Nocardia araoensis TaxID=228600 RepID=UPI0002D37630|nr:hypothetical protein [Nocardia araoensis]